MKAAWAALGVLWTYAILPAITALGVFLAGLSTPVLVVIAVIMGLITAGLALYTHWDWLKMKAGEIWDAIVARFNLAVALVRVAFEALKIVGRVAMKALGDIIDIGLLYIKNAWNGMWSGLGGAVTTAWEFAKNVVKNSVNWIIDKINSVINAINSVSRVAGAFGISAPSMPTIPRLAEGGIVTKPTLAMIGEGGESEAVIPLSKMKDMGGGGGGVNIYFTGTF